MGSQSASVTRRISGAERKRPVGAAVRGRLPGRRRMIVLNRHERGTPMSTLGFEEGISRTWRPRLADMRVRIVVLIGLETNTAWVDRDDSTLSVHQPRHMRVSAGHNLGDRISESRFYFVRTRESEPSILRRLQQVRPIVGGRPVAPHDVSIVDGNRPRQRRQPLLLVICEPRKCVLIRSSMTGRIVEHDLPVVVARDAHPRLPHQEVDRLAGPKRARDVISKVDDT